MTLESLSPTIAVFLLVDHQTGVFDRVVKAPPREQVETNVRRLARAAALLEIPGHSHYQRGGGGRQRFAAPVA
jgi:hypothetical protein